MRRVETDMEVHHCHVGDFTWKEGPDGTRYLVCAVPDRSPRGRDNPLDFFCIPVTGPKAWNWDGDEDAPTITPSIRMSYALEGKTIEVWHGFVTAGALREC